VSQSFRRTPKNYDGTHVTSHRISDLLPTALAEMGAVYRDRPDMILAAWPMLVGPQVASMTQAVQFHEGVLRVKVHNSPLYSLLSQHEKIKLLRALRSQFPKVEIKNILFRIG
jgi:Dna[CI] antecedent, DciA